jgi:hypothetical protein
MGGFFLVVCMPFVHCENVEGTSKKKKGSFNILMAQLQHPDGAAPKCDFWLILDVY